MKKILFITFLAVQGILQAQNVFENKRPKLVVGVVVDQMRYDYLSRFYNKFGDNGFKRLLNDGFNCENTHYNYIPTYTAVGHTSIYTGTTPSIHGIIGNNWYDKETKKSIYCVTDKRYETVGAKSGGDRSPYRMLTTTVTDALHLGQNMNGKVIGISIKDRAAILPAGHTANAAYWFQGKKTGKFISSSFYMEKLPEWVETFNASGKAKQYLNGKWETLLPIESYTESIADENDFEHPYKGTKKAVFPYDLKKLKKKNGEYDLIKATPFGNTLLVDFAEAVLKNEKLGKGNYTDFLTISFSSTDYIGHQFGVDSKEVEDTYIRLDRDLARLLQLLDKQVGKGNYTLFLTADHGAVQVPSYLQTQRVPSGYLDAKDLKEQVEEALKSKYGSSDIIENFSNFQFFLNLEKAKELKIDIRELESFIAETALSFPGILKAVTAHEIQSASYNDKVLNNLKNGYNQKRSGNVLLVPEPQWISYPERGSTHGSGFSYDTHVPLLFYGKGIRKGSTKKYIPITRIAATLASLLNVEFPDGSDGKVILEVLKD